MLMVGHSGIDIIIMDRTASYFSVYEHREVPSSIPMFSLLNSYFECILHVYAQAKLKSRAR